MRLPRRRGSQRAPLSPALVARPTGAGGRPPWSVVVVALAVAGVALAVALSALLLGDGGGDALERDRAGALAAARERTLALTSYDHRTLETDVEAVLVTATGPFLDDYRATAAQLRPTFASTQAVATASVVAAGLESAGPDRAVAVVAVDQVIRTSGAAPRTERNRLRMTLVRPDRTWLVERVERL